MYMNDYKRWNEFSLEDPDLTGESTYETHTVHPTGFSGKTDEIGGKQ